MSVQFPGWIARLMNTKCMLRASEGEMGWQATVSGNVDCLLTILGLNCMDLTPLSPIVLVNHLVHCFCT